LLKVFVWGLLALTGCQAFAAPDVSATLQAENELIIQEATAIEQAERDDYGAIAATADAVMTEVAGLQQANLVLLATVRAGDPPDQSVIVSMEGQVPQLTPGQRWFTRTGVSQFINDADGCVVSPQITFTADVPIIYATMRVFNIEPGVQLSALWEREGMEVFRDSFVLSQGAAEICIWFSITQNDAPLTPGNWAVRLFADGAALESPLAFSIQEAAMQG
jgi:hypothetical protein